MKKKSLGIISLLLLLPFYFFLILDKFNYLPSPVTLNLTRTPPPSWSRLSEEEEMALRTWNLMKDLVADSSSSSSSPALPNYADAVAEAGAAWNHLVASVQEQKRSQQQLSSNRSISSSLTKQCPRYLARIDRPKFDDLVGFRLRIPCGLAHGSSVTVIGIPTDDGNFRVDLIGGEEDGNFNHPPPIIVRYEVRLRGDDRSSQEPVIFQNTRSKTHQWGREERCPDNEATKNNGTNLRTTVDGFEKCNEMVGKKGVEENSKKYFPFQQNDLFAATLRINSDGIQTTVDGKHVTSFGFRGSLEPWLVSEVRISGDVGLLSVIASGLPTSEEFENMTDSESLKAIPINDTKKPDLLIGVVSTANNFERRMAVRRSWMQYPQVKSGDVAVRFFVGLHKNQMVNKELWREATIYRDVQLLPFVEYYSLLTLKTIAICISGSEIVSANYIMKTDDDSFVRIDGILNSLRKANASRGLFYGHMNFNSLPNRDPTDKWYITDEEWPENKFPVWANGPGYIVSSDIARTVTSGYRNGSLQMIKLEDVSMGIWIEEMKAKGLNVRYENEDKIGECSDGFVVAHYQNPRQLICLWQKVKQKKRLSCCQST